MKCVILCAGYATRLGELTRNCPKHLLPVADRPMLDHVIERIAGAGIRSGLLVTNRRFYPHFVRWASTSSSAIELELVDDGTDSNDNRLGAIGDLDFALRVGDVREDFLVVNGDNLFSFSLEPMIAGFGRNGTTIALYDVCTAAIAREMGIARCDAGGRIDYFVEKPADPPSTLASTGIYLFASAARDWLAEYFASGGKPDRTGDFIAWLYPRHPVFGHIVTAQCGRWFDIGTPDQYREADETWRRLFPHRSS